MAIDQLSIYNNALFLLGERKLATITETRKPRYDLDTIYDLGAVDYCLEIIKPVFATTTAVLTTSVASTQHDLDNVFTLPAGFVDIVGVYSDSKLDQPISRYIIDASTLACEYSTIYIRYITNTIAISTWSPSFARVVSAYLAREYAETIAPDEFEKAEKTFNDRVEAALALERGKEPAERSKQTTTTLTNTLRHIYNDALSILGLPKIVANDDDSNRRSALDTAWDAELIRSLLEDIGWTFAIETQKSQYDPSLEPEWGYSRVHAVPSDLLRLDGVFTDEYLRFPLKYYFDEGDNLYTDYDEIYIQYVSTDYVSTPDSWPTSFKRLVAGRLAKDAGAVLVSEGANVDRADIEYESRERTAYSSDAVQSPPRLIHEGSWVRSRTQGRSNRDRP
jgi:hypothetical protein